MLFISMYIAVYLMELLNSKLDFLLPLPIAPALWGSEAAPRQCSIHTTVPIKEEEKIELKITRWLGVGKSGTRNKITQGK